MKRGAESTRRAAAAGRTFARSEASAQGIARGSYYIHSIYTIVRRTLGGGPIRTYETQAPRE